MSSWLRAWCLCPLLGWNVLPGVSHTTPRATAPVRVWVGRGQTSIPRDIAGRQGAGGCCVKGSYQARRLIFQETQRKLSLRVSGTVLRAVRWAGAGGRLPAVLPSVRGSTPTLEEPQKNAFPSRGGRWDSGNSRSPRGWLIGSGEWPGTAARPGPERSALGTGGLVVSGGNPTRGFVKTAGSLHPWNRVCEGAAGGSQAAGDPLPLGLHRQGPVYPLSADPFPAGAHRAA